ncbi:MFS transporter [Aureliella helgolandensis]|uniref:Hexuronate transporter n=1 Tax=Aureliella helgolandensis TaxID=2527968 RepID=A0A518GG16_9BACT|nr:MFS transporter [Aureliella helgolandensis]QDV27542.1 Hexuronate transporter [Aureliella helgolandensis]
MTSILVNYIDRGALSVAIPAIQLEFSLSPSQKGLLLSVFFWTYALMQLPAGWLVDRFDVKWVYAGGYVVWTVATALTGLTTGFYMLLAARLLLGVGESAAYPAISRLVVENFPEERRGLVNSLIDAGTKIGPALSILVGGLLVSEYGWRPLFIALGLGGMVWLIPWIRYVPSRSRNLPGATTAPTENASPSARHQPPISQVAFHPAVWGTSLGMFALGYVWYFLLTWLPTYLMDVHQLNLKETAVSAALPFLTMAASSVFWGWAADRLIAKGCSPTFSRKLISLSGLGIAAALLLAASRVASPTSCIALLCASCAALGMFTANVWAMTQTLAGPAAGSWTGIQNCIGNMGGVLSPLVAGWSVEMTGSYLTAFGMAAAVMLAGIAGYLFIVGPIQEINWKPQA